MNLLQQIKNLVTRGSYDVSDMSRSMDLSLFGAPTESGNVVSSATAMQFETVHSIVKAISEDIAKLPIPVLERVSPRERQEAFNHPVHYLLKVAPNPSCTAYSFRQTLLAHVLTWGNGYAQIVRDSSERPAQLWNLDPSRMTVTSKDRERVYLYKLPGGDEIPLTQREVFHVHGMGFDGVQGYNPITVAMRDAIDLALSADKYGREFFTAPLPMVVLKGNFGGQDGPRNRNAVREAWTEAIKTKKRVGVIDAHVEVAQPVSKMPNDAAQFLGTRRFQKEQLAMFYRIPRHKLQDLDQRAQTSVEQQSMDYVNDCLMPWAVNFEQATNHQLLDGSRRYYIRHNFYSLLRGDSKAQGEFFKMMFDRGVFSGNDIRALMEMNPIEGGDRRYVPMNFVPTDKVDELLAPKARAVKRALPGMTEEDL